MEQTCPTTFFSAQASGNWSSSAWASLARPAELGFWSATPARQASAPGSSGGSPWGSLELTLGISLESHFLSHSNQLRVWQAPATPSGLCPAFCKLKPKQEGEAVAYLAKRADPASKTRSPPCCAVYGRPSDPSASWSWNPGRKRQPNYGLLTHP